MDKAGQAGTRYAIVDPDALAVLWRRLAELLVPDAGARGLHRVAEVLEINYATAHAQVGGPSGVRWRDQMRPATARRLLAGIGEAVRRETRRVRRREGREAADQCRERLHAELFEGLWKQAIRRGNAVTGDDRTLPELPTVYTGPAFVPLGEPTVGGVLRWWHGRERPRHPVEVHTEATWEGHRFYLIGKLSKEVSADRLQLLRWSALRAMNTVPETLPPPKIEPEVLLLNDAERSRSLSLALWQAILSDGNPDDR